MDPKYHIWVEFDASGYVISGVLNQLTLNNLGQWHPIAFFSRKIILAKTWYETYNDKLMAIVKAFET